MSHITDEAVVEATPEIEALLMEFRLAKRETAAAKAREDEIKDRVHAAFDGLGASEFTVEGRKIVSRTLSRRTDVDAKIVARLAPKAFEKARKVTEFYKINLAK